MSILRPRECTRRLTTCDWFGCSMGSRAWHPLTPSWVILPLPGQVKNTRSPASLDFRFAAETGTHSFQLCSAPWSIPWLWVRLCNHAATSVSSGVLSRPSFATTVAGARVMAEPGYIIKRQSRRLLEGFLILGLLALFALGEMLHYSSTTLYLAAFSSVSGCWMWNTDFGFFGR